MKKQNEEVNPMGIDSNKLTEINRTILLIDDDVILHGFISALLEKKGYKVFKAFNGDEGFHCYSENNPDLIITDIVMPVKEGFEMIMAVRENDKTTPIIAMSGGNLGLGPDYLEMAKNFGANVVLDKPFETKKLLTTICTLLSFD